MKQKEIIKKFAQIRDLPYEISPLYEGEKLIKYGKGGCGPKNRYLAKYLVDHGYEVKICMIPYRWCDLKNLPTDLKNLPRAQKIGTHVYLKTKINQKWILIDATWDKGLSKVLPVNLNWDGKSNQICATKIQDELCMDYPEPYLTWRKNNKKPIKLTKLDRDFSTKMNQWFNNVRTTNK